MRMPVDHNHRTTATNCGCCLQNLCSYNITGIGMLIKVKVNIENMARRRRMINFININFTWPHVSLVPTHPGPRVWMTLQFQLHSFLHFSSKDEEDYAVDEPHSHNNESRCLTPQHKSTGSSGTQSNSSHILINYMACECHVQDAIAFRGFQRRKIAILKAPHLSFYGPKAAQRNQSNNQHHEVHCRQHSVVYSSIQPPIAGFCSWFLSLVLFLHRSYAESRPTSNAMYCVQ